MEDWSTWGFQHMTTVSQFRQHLLCAAHHPGKSVCIQGQKMATKRWKALSLWYMSECHRTTEEFVQQTNTCRSISLLRLACSCRPVFSTAAAAVVTLVNSRNTSATNDTWRASPSYQSETDSWTMSEGVPNVHTYDFVFHTRYDIRNTHVLFCRRSYAGTK